MQVLTALGKLLVDGESEEEMILSKVSTAICSGSNVMTLEVVVGLTQDAGAGALVDVGAHVACGDFESAAAGDDTDFVAAFLLGDLLAVRHALLRLTTALP